MDKVYLDYAATTPIDPKVLSAMLPYMKSNFGNASSLHSFGQKAREGVEKAREQVANFLNCQTSEIFFTGSATESDNLAILGLIGATKKKGIAKPHIITSQIEHPAVLEPIKKMEKLEEIEVIYLKVSKEGVVNPEDVIKAIKPDTILISIMYANNEIGTTQPITKIANLIRNFRNSKQYPIFHTDAVQAANYLDCDVQKLGVDMLTLSGHKIYGPKGVGILYIKKGILIDPIIFGGHQENGLRPGTENVAVIAGIGKAIEIIKSQNLEVRNLIKLRDNLISGILGKIPGTHLNGSRENRLPNNVNISFSGVEGESILMALDQEGIAVSTGSACASGSLSPSHVLMALGLSHQQAHGSIRFTLGRATTGQEIKYVLKVLPKVIEKLRKISPIK